MEKGRILYLNGVTSSGKTSIVEALQARRDVFFYVVANDLFQEMIGEEYLQEVEKGPSSQERDDSAYFAEREHDAAGRVIFLQVNDTGKTISYNDDGSVRTTTDILPAEGFIRRLTDSVRTEYDDRGIVVSQRFVTHKRTGDSEERYGCEIRTVDYEHDKNGRRIPKKGNSFCRNGRRFAAAADRFENGV